MHVNSPRGIAPALAAGIASAALLTACAATPPAPAAGPPQAAVWQRHQAMIHYFGLTAQYSCDGFEEKVRELLLYLGARPDLKVRAAGCNRAFDRPGHVADADADFYTLAPTGDTASSTTSAGWARLTIKPMVPVFMDYGECELVQQLKSVITEDFSSRDLNYHTSCTPYEETISDYSVTAEFLKPLERGNSPRH